MGALKGFVYSLDYLRLFKIKSAKSAILPLYPEKKMLL